jgi:hypothetical protein
MFTFPNRGKEYRSISNEITSELEPYSGSELLDILDNKVKEFSHKINTVSTELQRIHLRMFRFGLCL